MVTYTVKKFFSGTKPIIFLFGLVFLLLYLMNKASYSSTNFGPLYTKLLIINVTAMIILVVLIIKNLFRLIIQYRNHEPGSRLTMRLVVMLIILALTPVSLVYYYSSDFISSGIDDWFNITVEKALSDSLKLSQASLELRTRELKRQTEAAANHLGDIHEDFAAIKLHELRLDSSATEMTLFYINGHIIASSNVDANNLIPTTLDNITQQNLRDESFDSELVTIQDIGLHIRVAVKIPNYDQNIEHRVLQALYPISNRMNVLADSVTSTYTHYQELLFLRQPLKNVFLLTLSLVLLLSLLASVWAAFFFARRLVQPISDLVEGTRAVADGNYQKKLVVAGKDELGFLVGSFNQMTQKISEAQTEASLSQQQAEAQRGYLEAVLSNLSSGVITLDEKHLIKTSNTIAEQVLACKLKNYLETDIINIIDDHTHLHTFFDIVITKLNANQANWSEEITLFGPGGRRVLMCRGTTLPSSDIIPGGHVVVFDDITTLLQAQRDAAWGEVARRLAHEIKNPLTPIQLSAERLRHKYLDKNQIAEPDLLDRSTTTIIHQVETLKEMVKAFSDYAQMPTLNISELDLNDLIIELLSLYKDINVDINFVDDLDPLMPNINADIGRLRQVLHNLIKNAQEANDKSDAKIIISTRSIVDQNVNYVEVKVNDNGPGISEDVLDNLFDPYVSTKIKGTGLGLAIVKKIVEEHSGVIWAENLAIGGTTVVIRLPILANPKSDTTLTHSPMTVSQSTKNRVDERQLDSDNNSSNNDNSGTTGNKGNSNATA